MIPDGSSLFGKVGFGSLGDLGQLFLIEIVLFIVGVLAVSVGHALVGFGLLRRGAVLLDEIDHELVLRVTLHTKLAG